MTREQIESANKILRQIQMGEDILHSIEEAEKVPFEEVRGYTNIQFNYKGFNFNMSEIDGKKIMEEERERTVQLLLKLQNQLEEL